MLAERESISENMSSELTMVLDWERDSDESLSEITTRKDALECYRFYANKQDNDDKIAELESKNRPASVFNEIKPKIDMVIGMAAQLKHDTQIIPVTMEDGALAELVWKSHKHYRNKINLADREISCFEHTVKSGRSLLYFYIDGSNPFRPKIKTKRIPTYNFKLDPNSIEYDLSDAKYLIIDTWAKKEEIQKNWKNFNFSSAVRNIETTNDYPAYYNEIRDIYKVSECWYRDYEDAVWFINPLTGKDENLSVADFKLYIERVENGEIEGIPTGTVIQGFKSIIEIIKYIIYCGNQELEKGKSKYNYEGFPAAFYGAYLDDDTNSWFSAITSMKDPQRNLNTMRRQLSHLLQTLPKGILAQEAGTILNIEEYEARSSDPTFWLDVTKGGLDKFKFVQQPQISPIYSQLDQTYSQGIKNASGIQDSLMGMQQGTREPGITVKARQETAFTVLYTLYYNFSKSRLVGNKILLSFMQQYVTLPTVVRITGQEGAQLVEVNNQINPQSEGFNDITAGKYDLEFDETVETATIRNAIAEMLVEYNHNNPGSIPIDIILDYLNIPYTVNSRIKAHYEQQRELEQANIEADREVEILKITSKAQGGSK